MSGPLLAFDTSGPYGSVAVSDAGSTLARVSLGERQQHASRLVPSVDEALERASVARTDLAGIVVGEGPGSFTGVRVAAATAKALAHALRVPLWAVSSLAGVALASEVGPVRYVLFDARADRVYGACYGVGSAEVQELVAPHGGTLRDVLADDVPGGAVFLGDGAERHRALIEGAGFPVEASARDAVAEGLVAYLRFRPGLEPVADPFAWEPAYVRTSSAERLWTA